MADAIISKVLGELMSLTLQETQLVLDVKKEIEKLAINLQAIQAVLADAETSQHKDELAMFWLQKLKGVAYDMDDALDEWSTEVAQSSQDEEDEKAFSKIKKKVRFFVFLSCFCWNKLGFRHNLAVTIKGLNERLDIIALAKDRYTHKSGSTKGNQLVQPLQTTLAVDMPSAGVVEDTRENEKHAIMRMLKEQGSNPLHFISIAGMRGIGKTTLAKLIYDDPEITSHFGKRSWVFVSDPFDGMRILKTIRASLEVSPDVSTADQPQALVKRVKELIGEQKFLLVLDDVWNEDVSKWDQLQRSLIDVKPAAGSKVLVTTHKRSVAIAMGCKGNDIFPLGKLSDNKCWDIFSEVASHGEANQERERQEQFRDRIVDKCKGLPLAAKTLGGLLRFKKWDEWDRVLSSELWEFEEVEKGLFSSVWMSYYDLPSALKQCFSYCAMFPKDYVFRKDELIGMWMAQGYLKETRIRSIEVVGEEYFEHLAMRFFFENPEEKMHPGTVTTTCKMHGIVHDFAQLITKGECLSLKITDAEEKSMKRTSLFHKEARHATVVFELEGTTTHSVKQLLRVKQLRSLVVVEESWVSHISQASPKLFDQLTCLRSLDLSSCDIEEIPSTISKLIHLRRLNLSRNVRLRELPEALCKLYNLQTLDVSDCWKLGDLPRNIGDLINLRHLLLDPLRYHGLMPKGIGRLTSLRTLPLLPIGPQQGDKRALASVGDLQDLNLLQGGLRMTGLGRERNEDGIRNAKQAQLKKKQGITSLRLSFESAPGGTAPDHHAALMEALEPSANLQELEIGSYRGTSLFPGWNLMSMTNLRKLTLRWCTECQHLPPLGKLKSLEHVKITNMKSLRKVGAEFLGVEAITATTSAHESQIFPKLTTLEFQKMEEWEEWEMSSSGNVTIMPSLHSLVIEDCPKLKALPQQVRQKATIRKCPILSPERNVTIR